MFARISDELQIFWHKIFSQIFREAVGVCESAWWVLASIAMVGSYHTDPTSSHTKVTDFEVVASSCPKMRSRLSLSLPGVPPAELRRLIHSCSSGARRSSEGGTPGRGSDSLDLINGHANATASESVTFGWLVGGSV